MYPPDRIIIRPPVEARSVLIPVTGGCSWNLCRFCGVYKGIQDYAIRPLEKVFEDIEKSALYYPNAPHIYLAGGNPTSAPTDYLVKILNKVYNTFRDPRRVSCYAKVLDILRKSEDDMGKLAEAG